MAENDPATDQAPEASLPLDLFEAGDEGFVAALRAVRDASALASFGARWYADPRPEARRLLSQYLSEPPNAPGHEGLVKRLFKLAEAARDDVTMARFLVLCDRLIVRRRADSFAHRRGTFRTAGEAEARRAEWAAEGYTVIETRARGFRRVRLQAWRPITARSTRNSTLPRPDWRQGEALAKLTPDEVAGRRWFSVATRRYLQRRAWRYFRHLGQTDPARYVRAATTALLLYQDADPPDGLSLLDRFGLMHILFGASTALRLRSTGWALAPGSTLADLVPAPAFADAWRDHPQAIQLLACTPQLAPILARWAWRWVDADPERFRALAPPSAWWSGLDSTDPEVVRAAIRLLDGYGVDQLRAAVATRPTWWGAHLRFRDDPISSALVADFLSRVIPIDAVIRWDAIMLARQRAEPVARLGWTWLVGQGIVLPAEDDEPQRVETEVGHLLRAECPALRPMILRALREALGGRGGAALGLIGLFLDSPDADARAEGLRWLRSDDALWDDAGLWARLAESPYPDVQAFVATASPPVGFVSAKLDAARAAVLLAPTGQARAKPAAVRGVVRRLEALGEGGDDAEVAPLLGLLADLARSSRAPERRAGLAALVALAERFPGWAARIEGLVPALQLGGGSAIVPG